MRYQSFSMTELVPVPHFKSSFHSMLLCVPGLGTLSHLQTSLMTPFPLDWAMEYFIFFQLCSIRSIKWGIWRNTPMSCQEEKALLPDSFLVFSGAKLLGLPCWEFSAPGKALFGNKHPFTCSFSSCSLTFLAADSLHWTVSSVLEDCILLPSLIPCFKLQLPVHAVVLLYFALSAIVAI